MYLIGCVILGYFIMIFLFLLGIIIKMIFVGGIEAASSIISNKTKSLFRKIFDFFLIFLGCCYGTFIVFYILVNNDIISEVDYLEIIFLSIGIFSFFLLGSQNKKSLKAIGVEEDKE